MTDTPQVLLAHHLKTLKLPTFLREYDKLARQLTLLPDPGPGGKLNTDLEGRDDKADEAAIFAGIQGTVGCPAVGAGCDA